MRRRAFSPRPTWQVAAESQRLVDRALELSRARTVAASTSYPDVIESEPTITPGLASPTSGGCGSCIGRDGRRRILRIAMRSHIVSGLCAAGLTILVVAALHFASGPKIDPILTAPLMPAFFLATSLGVRGGPDGMPSMLYVFGLSFLFWWIAIDLVWRIWRWVANPR